MSVYYGDNSRWFIGIVLDINDPERLGRIKVRIYGVHPDNEEDAKLEDLPWAHVVTPVTEGGSSGIGANTGIKPRAQVYGVFLDGKNSQMPLVIGSIPKIESRPVDARENENTVDTSRLAAVVPDDIAKKAKEIIPSLHDQELLEGETNFEKAYNYFINENGLLLTPQQACGILGNFAHETGSQVDGGDLDPTVTATEADGALAFGLAGWNQAFRASNIDLKDGPSRHGELEFFCAELGLDIKSLYAQLAYTKYELIKYPFLGLAKLRRARTPEEAADVFEKEYERPQPGSGPKRQENARKLFERLA